MTWTVENVKRAIREHPREAADALAAIQLGTPSPLTVDVLRASLNPPVTLEDFWVARLIIDGEHRLIERFAVALLARGIALEPPPPEEALDRRVDPLKLAAFLPRATALRCKIMVDDQTVGSGCLVGPSLVLTAWHVIAAQKPGDTPRTSAGQIEVELSDARRLKAVVPPAFESPMGDAEYQGTAPSANVDVEGRKDVALLAMDRPAAVHLRFAPIPTEVPPQFKRTMMYIFDFPNGKDPGIGIGDTKRMPGGVTARWLHNVLDTAGGSSGGAAFNNDFQLRGLHQGKYGASGRLVPLWVFLDDVAKFIEDDRAPKRLWSLDRTATGPIVIGRDAFFDGVAAAGREITRVRGVRIKRLEPEAGPTGLAFSYELLTYLLARHGGDQVLVRITFEEIVGDLDEHIRSCLDAVGVPVAPAPPGDGVGVGQAALEAIMKDRSRVLTAAIDDAAHARNVLAWLFIDTPSVPLPEASRLFLEGFIAAALVRHRIRLVVGGFETAQLAGLEFPSAGAAAGDGPPGFVVEFLGGFTETDVANFLSVASTDLLGEPGETADRIASAAQESLANLPNNNGRYSDADLETVAGRLRPALQGYVDAAANR